MLDSTTVRVVSMLENPHTAAPTADTSFLSREATAPARRLHRSMAGYAPTPLVELSGLAKRGGVRSVLVKDESPRFGLNAFKALGGLYALFRVVCRELGLDHRTATMDTLKSPEYRDRVSRMEFITTTDGNHGRGVSWAAGMLGCRAHVFMPRGSVEVRAQAIREVGNADVTITDLTYDDAVRYSAKLAEENGWFLVQDTAWPGYEDVPTWIVQGYTTMLFEALDQLRDKGYDRPSHVFLQAGVGAMAGGVLGALQSVYGTALPCVSIVEPDHVACIYESVQQQDGATHPATGDNITIMAGLNCGEVCQVTWPIMRDYADFCFACDDRVTARGMRVLAAPRDGDAQVISGESGAVTSGLVSLLLCDPAYAALRDKLKLDEHSVILLFSTEGDTDPAGWRNVVYNGAYPMAE